MKMKTRFFAMALAVVCILGAGSYTGGNVKAFIIDPVDISGKKLAVSPASASLRAGSVFKVFPKIG